MKTENNFSRHVIIFIISSIILTLVLNMLILPTVSKPKVEKTNYSFFLDKLEEGEITLVQVEDTEIRFKVETDEKKQVYSTGRMYDPELVERLHKDKNVVFTENFEETSVLAQFLIGWVLLIIIFILLWNLLMRGMSKRMGGNAMSFGKSNAKIYVKAQTGKTFADVAGQDEAKEALVEIVDFLHNPDKYAEIGANLPKGALLVGPPGTGKTLLAQAVAGEAEVPFFSISGSEFVEMFVGMGAAKVRDLFKQAAEKAPCIVFIDEIDTIGKKRDGNFSSNDEREQTLNQLLTEMDGFDGKKGVVILAHLTPPSSVPDALTDAYPLNCPISTAVKPFSRFMPRKLKPKKIWTLTPSHVLPQAHQALNLPILSTKLLSVQSEMTANSFHRLTLKKALKWLLPAISAKMLLFPRKKRKLLLTMK